MSIRTLRFTRSASLPQIGVEIAVVSKVIVMTQVYCVCVPPRSSTMIGIDEPTTVIDSIEQNMAKRRPESASSFWRVAFFSLGEVKLFLSRKDQRKLRTVNYIVVVDLRQPIVLCLCWDP